MVNGKTNFQNMIQVISNMVAPLLTCEDNHPTMTGLLPNKKRTLAHDLSSLESPGSTKHVVIVMDALKEFTTEILEWVLENIFEAGGTVTLLGVMPWPNIPILSKVRSDIWELGLQDLSIIEERNEGKSDAKYQKLQAIVDLCQKYGAVPQIKVAMGYPVRSVVIEQIISLHATWVVFDRNHQKYREFYTSKVPCNMVVMNDEGGFDMIKGRAMINDGDTPGESPLSLAPTPKVVLSEQLKEKAQENDDKESVHEKERTGNGMKQGGNSILAVTYAS